MTYDKDCKRCVGGTMRLGGEVICINCGWQPPAEPADTPYRRILDTSNETPLAA